MAPQQSHDSRQHTIRGQFNKLTEAESRTHQSDGHRDTDIGYEAMRQGGCTSHFNLNFLAIFFTALFLMVAPISVGAQSAENFYQGKTINLIVGYPSGGAPDVYARLVARYLPKHLPGNPFIVVRTMPGAGSILAANNIFNLAPKDGTTLGLLAPTLPLEEALGSSASRYKASRFNWIGRLATNANITFIMNTSQVKTIADAFDKVAILSATGGGSTNALYPTVLNNVLGTKFKIVTGYEGSAPAMLAMERGEVEGHSATYDGLKNQHYDWVTTKRINIIVQYSLKRNPELPDVPTAVELARTPEQASVLRAIFSASDIGKFILTTPDIPTERVTALRLAFDAMVKDPDYLSDAEKLHIELDPLPGQELQKLVEEVESMDAHVLEKVKATYSLN